jgi:hypothetical protein
VMQVLYLSKDNDGNRFIEVEAPKHRFTVKVHSLQIQMHRDVMSMIDMWGRQREEKVYWVDLFPLDGEQRDELKEMADLEREEAEERKSQRRRDQMRDEVISYVIAHEPTMTELRDGVSGRNATISELVNEMVAEEKMKKVKDGKREKLVWIGGNYSPPEDPF